MGQAVVVRNAVIQRSPPNNDCWVLRGYSVVENDQDVRCLRPDLSPVERDDLEDVPGVDRLAAAQVLTPTHPFLRACVSTGLALPRAQVEDITDHIVAPSPVVQAAGCILGVMANNMQRGVDVYRAIGHTFNVVFPLVADLPLSSPLVPILSADVFLKSPTEPSEGDVCADLGWLLHCLHVRGEATWQP